MTGLELDLRVDYDAKALDGTATLHVRNASPRPARTIPLLLGRLMHVSRIRASGRGDASLPSKSRCFATTRFGRRTRSR
jgi:hypothetical protein